MKIIEFEKLLINNLTDLSNKDKCLYSLYCLERIYGLYHLYLNKFNIDINKSKHIKNKLWDCVGKGEKNRDLFNEIEKILPLETFVGWEVSIGINVSICFDVCLKSINDDFSNIQNSGIYVYDTICQVCFSLSNEKFITTNLMDKIEHSTLINNEIRNQIYIIQYIKNNEFKPNNLFLLQNDWQNNSLTLEYIKENW